MDLDRFYGETGRILKEVDQLEEEDKKEALDEIQKISNQHKNDIINLRRDLYDLEQNRPAEPGTHPLLEDNTYRPSYTTSMESPKATIVSWLFIPFRSRSLRAAISEISWSNAVPASTYGLARDANGLAKVSYLRDVRILSG